MWSARDSWQKKRPPARKSAGLDCHSPSTVHEENARAHAFEPVRKPCGHRESRNYMIETSSHDALWCDRAALQRGPRNLITQAKEGTSSNKAAASSPHTVMEHSPTPSDFQLDLPKHVTWDPERVTCISIERLAYTDIVGDIRDDANPNFCAIGCARSIRLSGFAGGHIESMAERWFQTLKREMRRRRRARRSSHDDQL